MSFFKYSMDHLWINTATSSWKNRTNIFHKCLVSAVDPSIHPNISVVWLINVVLTFIPFEGPDTMKHIALDCNKALYGVFAFWKLLWKLTCSIIRNYLEFSASFSFICESGRNQHVEMCKMCKCSQLNSCSVYKNHKTIPIQFFKSSSFFKL